MRITFAERTELFLFFLLVLLQDGYFLRVLQRHRVTQKYEVALPSSNYSLKKMDKYTKDQQRIQILDNEFLILLEEVLPVFLGCSESEVRAYHIS